MSHTYSELQVWQKAMALVRETYVRTRMFPREEVYGLAAQMRRSAISIPSNIAEGPGRLSKGEFKQFLGVARGSLLELEQILIAKDLRYFDEQHADAMVSQSQEVLRMLNGLLDSLLH